MNKSETATVKKELRTLKSALSHRQKQTVREVKKRRDIIRQTEREIARIEADLNACVVATSDRMAILEGRLLS